MEGSWGAIMRTGAANTPLDRLTWRIWANMNTRVSFSAARPDYLFDLIFSVAGFTPFFAENKLIKKI
jgi:hypothetical protein